MSTQDFQPSACNLCYANCGILVKLDEAGQEIVKVRGDKAHPISKGYTCNKAARINFYQNAADRLNQPLRRREDGTFEAVDWETAISEVASRFAAIRDDFGGDKIMYYGGGGQGNHLGGSYSHPVQKALGMRYKSNAIAQEKTGKAWTANRVLGGSWHGDFEHCDVAIIIGKNPWQSNGMQKARIVMRDLSKTDGRTLIVLDPRRSETADLADIHLAVKPGTDVWCISAILAYMAQNSLLDLAWLQEHTTGYERVLSQLTSIDVKAYAEFAGIAIDQIVQVAELLAATDKIAVYEDLGIEMAPYSTLCTYLNILLFVLPGAFDQHGGMHLTTGLATASGRGSSKAWIDDEGYEHDYPTTPVTGARIINGLMPCNSIPEEIDTDHPDRFRGMLVESSNPAHSLADSQRFRSAFEALDFLVVIDVAMTETAQLADYVLPASSQYEKYEATFFPAEFPENFFHLRKPLIPPREGTLTEPEMHARLVEALGVFEPGALDELESAAAQGLEPFTDAMNSAMQDRKIAQNLPYVLYRTLGPHLPNGAASAAGLWGLCQRMAREHGHAVRAAGHSGEGSELGNNLFNAILESESGLVICKHAPGDYTQWKKLDQKLHLHMAEMSEEIEFLKLFKMPKRTDEFPLLLAAGERRTYTANTVIRDPAWMKNADSATLFIHPTDAEAVGVTDAAEVKLVTRRGTVQVIAQFDDRQQQGTIALPNGLGLSYPSMNKPFGVAPNDLTDLDDRDPWVGTPWHKHVRARVESLAN